MYSPTNQQIFSQIYKYLLTMLFRICRFVKRFVDLWELMFFRTRTHRQIRQNKHSKN